MKSLASKRVTKSVPFMGEKMEISKLTVDQVLAVQESAKDIESSNDPRKGFEVIKVVIRAAVPSANDLSDEEFNSFPLDELSNLSNEIMKFSGIGPQGNGS